MARSSIQLETFIRKIHRRWVIWRALERGGIGLLAGCVFAAALYPILLWRGQPAMPMILGALGLGTACGLILGLKSRPTVLGAAIEADRQLKLHDLLSSAISVGNTRADEWSAAVIAMANARTQALVPRDVILNRLGARAWGGIGLGATLMLTLGILSTNPIITQAVARAQGRAFDGASSNPQTTNEGIASRAQPPTKRMPDEPASEDHSIIPAPSSNESNSTASTVKKPGDASNGTGTGRSTTDAKSKEVQQRSASSSNASRIEGNEAGAGGIAKSNAPPGHDASGSSVNAQPRQSPTAWQASDWSTSRTQALQQIQDGKAPAAYHDLIRDYFNRDVDH